MQYSRYNNNKNNKIMKGDLRDRRLYVCSNYGEYAHFARYQTREDGYCGWGFEPLTADIFRDYKDAYNHMKRINKFYGFERCRVEKLIPSEWKPEYWERLKQAEHNRNMDWWREDQRRHEFAGLKW